jgi:hypothetical protein
MTSDEIMHVLRLTAMSRVNHPDQQRFCEALEKVFARPEPAAPAELTSSPEVVAEAPKRRKKAD